MRELQRASESLGGACAPDRLENGGGRGPAIPLAAIRLCPASYVLLCTRGVVAHPRAFYVLFGLASEWVGSVAVCAAFVPLIAGAAACVMMIRNTYAYARLCGYRHRGHALLLSRVDVSDDISSR